MAEPLEMIDTLSRLVERLTTEWGKLDHKVDHLQRMLDQLPNNLGALVSLPSPHQLSQAHLKLDGIPPEIPSIRAACWSAKDLTQAAAEWRRVALTLAPPVTDAIEALAIARPGWESLAADQYHYFTQKRSYIAADLTVLLKNAATAIEEADLMIHNWVTDALMSILVAAGSLITLILSWTALLSSVANWALTAFGAFGAAGEAALFAAITAMDAAVGPITVAVTGLIASLALLVGSIYAINAGLTNLSAAAAREISRVTDRLRDTTPWPDSHGVPSQGSWAIP